MPRTTLGDLRRSRIPESINIGPRDTRFAAYINEATQRLINKGRWWGTIQKYAFSATSGEITLPRQIATVESVALSHCPVPVRDMLYEFIDNSWGTRSDESGTVEAIYRGRFPLYSDIVPKNKKVVVQCDLASDADVVGHSSKVLILGYDDDGNWIRTSQGGVVMDGEVLAFAQSPGTTSTSNFSVVTDIQVQQTMDGQWWLYELNLLDMTSRLVGQYQYDDARPSFARYLFPSIGTTSTLVECLVKLDFIPVVNDSDYCLIGNVPALKQECMAVKAMEENRYTDAEGLEAKAIQILNEELDSYLGVGRRLGINVISNGITSNDPVNTFI